jgi:hypothetical protein
MGFSKVRMGKQEIFKVEVRDIDGRVLENWQVMKRDFPRVVRILNDKFGLDMIITDKNTNKDLDWAIK